MKLKLSKKGHSYRLKGIAQIRDKILFSEAEVIKNGSAEIFLPAVYIKRANSTIFHYSLGPSLPLLEHMKIPASQAFLKTALYSFVLLGKKCNEFSLSFQRSVFDPRFVFYDPLVNSMRFIYMPVQQQSKSNFALDQLLELILSQRAYKDESATEFANSALEQIRSKPLFSWTDIESLLEDMSNSSQAQSQQKKTPIPESTEIDRRLLFGYDFVQEQLSARG